MSKDLTQNLNGSLEDKVDRLIIAVQSMDTRFESMDSRLGNVEARLGRLETTIEERLKDTRPMWEAVQTQLAEMRESQDRLRGEMEKGFRLVDRRLESHPVEYEKLYRYHRDLEERVERIEKQSS